MLPSRLAHAKAALKANVPAVAAAYRTLRRLPGLDGGGRRRSLTRFIRDQTGSRVASGPFAGMRLVEGASWGDGDVAPKLLGTYEAELHPSIAAFSRRTYDAVVDLGCAEGYYAVGLARLFPGVPVFAFDTDAKALRIAAGAVMANEVRGQVVFGGFCDWAALADLATRFPRLLVLSDCEGFEVELFGPGDRRLLAQADLLIECHEKLRPDSTAAMTAALDPTHTVRRIGSGGRNPNGFAFLADLHETDRWAAVCENRPYGSHWLACESRLAAAGEIRPMPSASV